MRHVCFKATMVVLSLSLSLSHIALFDTTHNNVASMHSGVILLLFDIALLHFIFLGRPIQSPLQGKVPNIFDCSKASLLTSALSQRLCDTLEKSPDTL